jgi:phage terminase large subunit-like protein
MTSPRSPTSSCRIEDAGLLAEKHAIAVDSPASATSSQRIDQRGARHRAPDRIVGIDQGWKLNGAIKTTERKVAGGELIHDGSKMMTWCVGNAKAEQRECRDDHEAGPAARPRSIP